MAEHLEKTNHVIKPSAEYPLEREYIDTSSLRLQGEKGVYVDRLNTGISTNGETLNAEDILDGTVVILTDKNKGLSYLAVVEDVFTAEHYLKMRQLAGGKYDLVVVVGEKSVQLFDIVTHPRGGFMEAFNNYAKSSIDTTKEIGVDYQRRGWCIAFNPANRIVKIYTKSDKIVREYRV